MPASVITATPPSLLQELGSQKSDLEGFLASMRRREEQLEGELAAAVAARSVHGLQRGKGGGDFKQNGEGSGRPA